METAFLYGSVKVADTSLCADLISLCFGKSKWPSGFVKATQHS